MTGSNPIRLPTGLAAALLAALALPTSSLAHQAKSGWSYPYACCSNQDCREVPATLVSEKPEGYVINSTGEVLRYTDRRVRQSPDGVYHWCSVAGEEDSRTVCLFVPPRSF